MFLKNSWNSEDRLILFRETCLTNNYLSHEPYFVILAWVQSWNIFEKLNKVCSPPEFFHKNMSQEQLLFTWSTFCDSTMGTKLKYFWKTHEIVKSAWIYSQKHVSRTITLHHVKSNCSWDMFLWKNSGGLHTLMSFSIIFQLCTHARYAKNGSGER